MQARWATQFFLRIKIYPAVNNTATIEFKQAFSTGKILTLNPSMKVLLLGKKSKNATTSGIKIDKTPINGKYNLSFGRLLSEV